VQEKIDHEMVEEIFLDKKIVDHVNHYLNQPVYDIFEVEQTSFVGYEEEKVYFHQSFVARSYNVLSHIMVWDVFPTGFGPWVENAKNGVKEPLNGAYPKSVRVYVIVWRVVIRDA
jgi:hypothetical protein